jgi:hypothetical protein
LQSFESYLISKAIGFSRYVAKLWKPTSYPKLQDFLDALQSFEAYLRSQATGFPKYVAKL